jgi:hypothetical protein
VSNTKDWEEYDATMSLEDRLTLAAIRRRLEEVGMIPHTELWPGRGEAGGYGGKRSRKNKTAV